MKRICTLMAIVSLIVFTGCNKANPSSKKVEVPRSNTDKNMVETSSNENRVSVSELKTTVIVPYPGSSCYHDDKIGYEEFFVGVGQTSDGKAEIREVEGYIRHRFCYAPSGRSQLEMINFYKEAVLENGGIVFPKSNKEECVKAFMKMGHPKHYQTKYEYMQLPGYAGKYFSGIIPTDTVDYYVCVVTAKIDGKVVYSLVGIEMKAMDKP